MASILALLVMYVGMWIVAILKALYLIMFYVTVWPVLFIWNLIKTRRNK